MKTFKSIKAETYITPCVLIIVIATIFSGILTYASAISKVNIIRENSKIVLDSYITENAVEIYNSIKQGNDFTEALNEDKYRTSLKEFCTLDINGTKMYSYDSEGNERYSITAPELFFKTENELELQVGYTVYVPIRFMGVTVSTANVPVKVTSDLAEKF